MRRIGIKMLIACLLASLRIAEGDFGERKKEGRNAQIAR